MFHFGFVNNATRTFLIGAISSSNLLFCHFNRSLSISERDPEVHSLPSKLISNRDVLGSSIYGTFHSVSSGKQWADSPG